MQLGMMNGSQGRDLSERFWHTAQGLWRRKEFIREVFDGVPDDGILAEYKTEEEIRRIWLKHGRPQPLPPTDPDEEE